MVKYNISHDDLDFRNRFSHILNQETARIEDIVKDLLAFSKPSEPKRQESDINQILRDTTDLLSSQMLKSSVRLLLDLQESAECFVDADQVKQALLNIIMNAIEAMSPSGGELIVRTGQSDGFLRIEIADTGPGIAKDKIAHLFDPFFTDKEGGTGLGLAITHSIIEKNGGKIRVESEAGVGTTFILRLPIATEIETKGGVHENSKAV